MENSELYVVVLKASENDVASALKEEDLVSFCSDLHRYRVISKREKQLFCSLDVDRIESTLVTRYLIQLVCDNIKEDASVWKKLLRVLANGGAYRSHVREVLCKELEKFAGKSCGASNKHSLNVNFTEKDIQRIVEVLTDISYKWEEISIALGLSTQARKDCRDDRSSVISLTNVINEWLNRNPSKCTLQELKNALLSETVGGSRSAMELDKSFNHTEDSSKADDSSKVSVVLGSELIIEYQSDDTEVTDGKSTLLGVQVSPFSHLISFQWKKNGEPLSNSSRYSGVHCDTLVISGSQDIEGAYSCVVTRGLEQVNCDDIDVTVEYSSTKQQLLDLYSNYREVPVDTWPPTRTNTFIQPTLFKCDNQFSIASSHQREGVAYEEVFGEYASGALVLVSGFAGSGKTTLSQKIVKDWARGSTLRGARLLIYVPLKLLRLKNCDHTLLDILKQIFHFPDQVKKQLLADIESRNGEGVCFVLDGWDEYQFNGQGKTAILQLIKKHFLPKSMVVVTSRPAATSDLEQEAHFSQKLELVGFSKNSLFEYIEMFQLQSQTRLKEFILSENHLLSICSLPMHAAMICFIFQTDNEQLPVTETSLYESFTRLTVLRHLKRENKSRRLKSLHDLEGEEKKRFHSLCELAFNMTVSSKQVASQDDFEVPSSVSDGNVLFGLVTEDCVAEIAGITKMYSFFHSTIQEFLAALYLLENKGELKNPGGLAVNSLMLNVWKFYCGLAKFEHYTYRQLNSSFLKKVPLSYMFLFAMECAAESRQVHVCDAVMQAAEGIALEYPLKPTHLSAIKYVLSVSSVPLHILFLFRHCTDEEGVTQILSSIKSCQWKSLTSLTLSKLSLGSAGACAIAECLQYCQSLKNLDLSHNCLCSEDIAVLSPKFCFGPKSLNLSHNKIQGDICNFAKELSLVKDLNLSFNKIQSDEIVSLVSGLKNTAETLDLQGNSRVNLERVLTLAEALNDLPRTMQDLHLDNDGVAPTDCKEYPNVNFICTASLKNTRPYSFSTYYACNEVQVFSDKFLQEMTIHVTNSPFYRFSRVSSSSSVDIHLYN